MTTDANEIDASAAWNFSTAPPSGERLALLNQGDVPVIGPWSHRGGFKAWWPLPSKSRFTAAASPISPPSGMILILTAGGTVIIDRWKRDPHFLGWHPIPPVKTKK